MTSKKKSTAQFKDEVYQLVHNDYEVVGEYVYALEKITMKHTKCGRSYEVTPAHFLTGNRCPLCSGKNRTTEDYKQIVKDLTNNSYVVLGEYVKAAAKVHMKHVDCGQEFYITPNSFMRGQRCPNCPLKRQQDNLQREKRIKEALGEDYRLLSSYKVKQKIKVQHLKCGNEYLANPTGILRGERCPVCARLSRTRTIDEVKQTILDLVGSDYEVIGPTTTRVLLKEDITLTHIPCQRTYNVKLSNFLQGSRCTQCAQKYALTHEEFCKEVKQLVGDEYTVIDLYKGRSAKIAFRHNRCGNQYETTPMNFVNGSRCVKCGIKERSAKRTKSHEKVVEDIYALVGNEYTLLSKYKNSKIKLDLRHNVCGNKYQVDIGHFMGGTRCPACFGNIKKDTDTFKLEVKNLVGEEYEVLGEYKTARIKIQMLHVKCGNRFSIVPDSFLRGTRCSSCSGNKKKNSEIFREEVLRLVGDEYSILGEYINSMTSVLIRHNLCGTSYPTKPNNFIKGHRCAICAKVKKKDTEVFSAEVKEKFMNEYDVLGEYIDARTPISVRHTVCGYEYSVTPDNLLRGKGCFYCNRMTNPEKDLYQLLQVNGLNFEIQKEFEDLKNESALRFDFCIYLNEEKTNFVLVEYDGVQHYRPIFGDESHQKSKLRDLMKESYCQQHQIPLKRIPYYKNHVKSISNFLESFGYKLTIPANLQKVKSGRLQH